MATAIDGANLLRCLVPTDMSTDRGCDRSDYWSQDSQFSRCSRGQRRLQVWERFQKRRQAGLKDDNSSGASIFRRLGYYERFSYAVVRMGSAASELLMVTSWRLGMVQVSKVRFVCTVRYTLFYLVQVPPSPTRGINALQRKGCS